MRVLLFYVVYWSLIPFLFWHFTGKACGTQLTLKTVTTKDGGIWCKSHIPGETPDQGVDLKTQTNMRKRCDVWFCFLYISSGRTLYFFIS